VLFALLALRRKSLDARWPGSRKHCRDRTSRFRSNYTGCCPRQPTSKGGRRALRDRSERLSSAGRHCRWAGANTEATFTERQQNLQRQTYLYRTHVNALQDFQNAQDSFAAAHAELASAHASLELAKLHLSYIESKAAPAEGFRESSPNIPILSAKWPCVADSHCRGSFGQTPTRP
jgi:hypothetical protein